MVTAFSAHEQTWTDIFMASMYCQPYVRKDYGMHAVWLLKKDVLLREIPRFQNKIFFTIFFTSNLFLNNITATSSKLNLDTYVFLILKYYSLCSKFDMREWRPTLGGTFPLVASSRMTFRCPWRESSLQCSLEKRSPWIKSRCLDLRAVSKKDAIVARNTTVSE